MYQSLLLGRARQMFLVEQHLQRRPLPQSKPRLPTRCSVSTSLVIHHLRRLVDHQARLRHHLDQQFRPDRTSSSLFSRYMLQLRSLNLHNSLKDSHRLEA